ncbi:MAG: DUF3383 domain-containing protein [Clostridiales bacterium]|nr:DUF3383 domain-containing protein [Clostridiales bacterium]
MANFISDVTVNISVEDVVNPAAFGGILLFTDTSEIEYTDVYSYDEAKELLKTTENDNKNRMLELVQTAFSQENPPEKLTLLGCDIDDLENYMSGEWRYIIYIATGDDRVNSRVDYFIKLAQYIESSEYMKVCIFDLSTADEALTLAYSDWVSYFETFSALERTAAFVGIQVFDSEGNEIANSIGTALMAETGGKDVGSFTYKNQVLKGVYPDESATKAQVEEYHSYNVNVFLTKAGYNVTSEGVLANGEYIDILDAKDWLITQIKYQVQQALIINDKVPYTNSGISLLESVVVNVLQNAYNNGLIAEDDNGDAGYTVNFAKRSETDASDRELRQYVEGKFSFDLAGAIHTVTINGTINI